MLWFTLWRDLTKSLKAPMTEENYTTTSEQFKIFKDEAEFWKHYLGLLDWEIYYEHSFIGEGRAKCLGDPQARIVTIVLTTEWHCSHILEQEIRKSAFHEICEVLLYPLRQMIESNQYIADSDIDSQIHQIIRRLENTLFLLFDNKYKSNYLEVKGDKVKL